MASGNEVCLLLKPLGCRNLRLCWPGSRAARSRAARSQAAGLGGVRPGRAASRESRADTRGRRARRLAVFRA